MGRHQGKFFSHMQGAVLAIFDESKGAVSLGQLSAFFRELVCGETVPVNWHSSRPESTPHLRTSSFLSDFGPQPRKNGLGSGLLPQDCGRGYLLSFLIFSSGEEHITGRT